MSSTQEKPRKRNKPLLCNCDGFWHITGFTDDTEQEVGIDFKALDEAYRVARNSIKQLIQTVEVEARLDEANRLTLELTDNKTS